MTELLPVFRPAGTGPVRNVLGMTHTNKAVSQETGGAFLLVETLVPPGCGAPLHSHEVDAECFYMLEGELRFVTAQGERVARAGDMCFIPRGQPHAFRNALDKAARALVIATPGRASEHFFDEIDEAMRAGSPHVASVIAIARRNEIAILPAERVAA